MKSKSLSEPVTAKSAPEGERGTADVNSLQERIEAFVAEYGPSIPHDPRMRAAVRYRFIEELRSLMNDYAREALKWGALPDSELHDCAGSPASGEHADAQAAQDEPEEKA